MILTILSIAGIVTVLVAKLWKYILAFLNGPVRDLLERIFGAGRCAWYVKFLQWADRQLTAVDRFIKMYWRKVRDTILKVRSKYIKNDNGTYTKRTESVVRESPETTTCRRVVTEETVDWAYLPNEVRAEMMRQRTNEGVLDDRAIAAEKIRLRAEEEGITLSA